MSARFIEHPGTPHKIHSQSSEDYWVEAAVQLRADRDEKARLLWNLMENNNVRHEMSVMDFNAIIANFHRSGHLKKDQ